MVGLHDPKGEHFFTEGALQHRTYVRQTSVDLPKATSGLGGELTLQDGLIANLPFISPLQALNSDQTSHVIRLMVSRTYSKMKAVRKRRLSRRGLQSHPLFGGQGRPRKRDLKATLTSWSLRAKGFQPVKKAVQLFDKTIYGFCTALITDNFYFSINWLLPTSDSSCCLQDTIWLF